MPNRNATAKADANFLRIPDQDFDREDRIVDEIGT